MGCTWIGRVICLFVVTYTYGGRVICCDFYPSNTKLTRFISGNKFRLKHSKICVTEKFLDGQKGRAPTSVMPCHKFSYLNSRSYGLKFKVELELVQRMGRSRSKEYEFYPEIIVYRVLQQNSY